MGLGKTKPKRVHSKKRAPSYEREENIANSVYEGDCLEVMDEFPAASIDMILCDLPYGTTQNKWDYSIDLENLWVQYRRVIKSDGAIVLTSQGLFTAKLILSNEKWFKYKMVWEKSKPTNFLNAKKQPLRKHEDICVFYKKQPTYNLQDEIGVSPMTRACEKINFPGSYGDFEPHHVKSRKGERYPVDIVYHKIAESEPEKNRLASRRRSPWASVDIW